MSVKKNILKKQGCCLVCLKHSHIAKNCDSKRACSNCSQRHHSNSCMAKETPASGNSIAGSAISMYINIKTSIWLQTCITLASNPTSVQPQEEHCVRITLDSGSQEMYITQQLKETRPETNSKGEIGYQDIWIRLQQP